MTGKVAALKRRVLLWMRILEWVFVRSKLKAPLLWGPIEGANELFITGRIWVNAREGTRWHTHTHTQKQTHTVSLKRTHTLNGLLWGGQCARQPQAKQTDHSQSAVSNRGENMTSQREKRGALTAVFCSINCYLTRGETKETDTFTYLVVDFKYSVFTYWKPFKSSAWQWTQVFISYIIPDSNKTCPDV